MGVTTEHFPFPAELFSEAMSQLQEGVCILDPEQNVAFLNPSAEKMLGWTRESLLNKNWHELLHRHQNTDEACPLLQKLGPNQPSGKYEDVLKRRDGTSVFVQGNVSAIKTQQETTWHIITLQTTDEQKATEKELQAVRKAIAPFRKIFETNMFGMVYGDFQGNILDANTAFWDMLGYTPQDFQKKNGESGAISWKEITPEEYAHLDLEAIRQLKDCGLFYPYEKQFIRKNGSRVDVMLGGIIEEGSRERAISFVLDISAKKRTERSVIKGEELFRKMADSSAALIWFITADYKMHYFNKTVLGRVTN